MNIPTKQRALFGFTLVEVLVTMVVMSIGLLGLAGLQATSLRSNSGANFRTQAILYANDMAERIRANPAAVADDTVPVPNHQFLNVNSTAINCGAALPVPYCEEFWDEGTNAIVPAATCNPAQLAAYDINTWICGGARDAGDPSVRGPGLNSPLFINQLLNGQLPQAAASIICNDNNGADADPCSPSSPHTITVSWRTIKESGSNFDEDVDGDGIDDCLNVGDASTDCHMVSLVIQP